MLRLRYLAIRLLGGIPITPAMRRRGITGEAQIKRLYTGEYLFIPNEER